jgi:hypothetical protein
VSQFRIYLLVVDNVIAMRAARPGLENGREIKVADAERVEIGQ